MQNMGYVATETGRKTASQNELRQLIETQEYRCALSGVLLTPAAAELDHVIPIAEGGTNRIVNLQVVHPIINRMKGRMNNDEFIQWCMKVADYQR